MSENEIDELRRRFAREAMALMEPLNPPAPGTPGGLPVDPAPVAEGSIDPDSAQGAAQVVVLVEQRAQLAQALGDHVVHAGVLVLGHFLFQLRDTNIAGEADISFIGTDLANQHFQ